MKYNILPSDAVRVNNRVYFFSKMFNGLFYSDLNDQYAHFLCTVPNEKVFYPALYSSMEYVFERYLCLIPFHADEIAVYDTYTNEIEKIELPDEIRSREFKFMPSTVINNQIYIFPLFDDYNIYRLDVSNREFVTQCSWKACSKNIEFDKKEALFRYQTVVYDGTIYIPFCNINAMLMYDYQVNTCKIKTFDDNENGYSGIVKVGSYLYCSPRKIGSSGIKWNIQDNRYEYLDSNEEYTIGIKEEKGEYKFCSSNDYGFIRNDEPLYYSNKYGVIILEDKEKFVWNTSIKDTQFFDEKKIIKDNKVLTENEFFDVKKFLKGIM